MKKKEKKEKKINPPKKALSIQTKINALAFGIILLFSVMLTMANAAASIITTRKGALRVMPSVSEIKELLAVK